MVLTQEILEHPLQSAKPGAGNSRCDDNVVLDVPVSKLDQAHSLEQLV